MIIELVLLESCKPLRDFFLMITLLNVSKGMLQNFKILKEQDSKVYVLGAKLHSSLHLKMILNVEDSDCPWWSNADIECLTSNHWICS